MVDALHFKAAGLTIIPDRPPGLRWKASGHEAAPNAFLNDSIKRSRRRTEFVARGHDSGLLGILQSPLRKELAIVPTMLL
jgi:hypothetical protein